MIGISFALFAPGLDAAVDLRRVNHGSGDR